MTNPEHFIQQIIASGIPEEQVPLIKSQLNRAKNTLADSQDTTDPLSWITNELHAVFSDQETDILLGYINRNQSSTESAIIEEGYDSNQSRRQVAKIIGEGLVIAGFSREFDLLGLRNHTITIKNLIHSHIDITDTEKAILQKNIEILGADQDFLFPGIIPTPSAIPVEEAVIETLTDNPPVSVRTLTGLGGMRFDHADNQCVDLLSFLDKKISQDYRYYPGMATLKAVESYGVSSIPTLQEIANEFPNIKHEFDALQLAMNHHRPAEYNRVTTLCATAIPTWHEIKSCFAYAINESLELTNAFHSPSYDISFLEELITDWQNNRPITDSSVTYQLSLLTHQLDVLYSFNNPLHLPYTQEQSNLSTELMGRITNQAHDSCIRYGIGHKGKSIEIKEYVFGQNRQWYEQTESPGTRAYEVVTYQTDQFFEGDSQSFFINPQHDFWQQIQQHGFIQAALTQLESL